MAQVWGPARNPLGVGGFDESVGLKSRRREMVNDDNALGDSSEI